MRKAVRDSLKSRIFLALLWTHVSWEVWLPSDPSHQVPSDFMHQQSAWTLESYNPLGSILANEGRA